MGSDVIIFDCAMQEPSRRLFWGNLCLYTQGYLGNYHQNNYSII
jgi:hypothetical protein